MCGSVDWDWTISFTSMGPCIANVLPSITNKMQGYTIYLFLWNTLHVSGGSSAHHQEFKAVYTSSGTLSNLYCYLPLSLKSCNISSNTVASSSKSLTKYPMLYIQFELLMMGGGTDVEHFTEINKLCNVASCWLYLKIWPVIAVGTSNFSYLPLNSTRDWNGFFFFFTSP